MLPTNSIIIANLPDWTAKTSEESNEEDVSHDSEPLPSSFLESLREVIGAHGEIVHWVPVRRYVIYNRLLILSFRRIFCTFVDPDNALLVKEALDGCMFEGHRLEVYFGAVFSCLIQTYGRIPP